MKARPHIVFAKGFSSYEDEYVRYGPINLGLAQKHMEPMFKSAGFQFHSIPNLGRGTPEEQAERGYNFLLDLSRREEISGAVHLLGHSAGGITSRALAKSLSNAPIDGVDLRTVLTITSPHQGSRLATMAQTLKTRRPVMHGTLKMCGYDLNKRKELMKPWTDTSMNEFNTRCPNVRGIHYASVISGLNLADLPLAFRLINHDFKNDPAKTDGIVELSSQSWGNILGAYELDHGAILGLRTTPSRLEFQKRFHIFEGMMERLIYFFRAHS